MTNEICKLKKENAMLKKDVQAALAAAKEARDHAKRMDELVTEMLSRYDGID